MKNMKNKIFPKSCKTLPSLLRPIVLLSILPFVTALILMEAHAGTAAWQFNPSSRDWSSAKNWTPATVPNGPDDVATFDLSRKTTLTMSSDFVELNGIIFNPGASAYTIRGSFIISGDGITNNSAATQSFEADNGISFRERAIAGSGLVFTSVGGGSVGFGDDANAGSATFISQGAREGSALSGQTVFFNRSSAANSRIINNPPQGAADNGGSTSFFDFSTAANSTVTNIVGNTIFDMQSSAADSTLIAGEGGFIAFFDRTTGGTARVELTDPGYLDITRHTKDFLLTIGSLKGNGIVYLAGKHLGVGSNGLDTTFSGVIRDDGGIERGIMGTLTKVGSGTFILSGANLYTGGTTIEEGTLLVKTGKGSATGTGPVQVNAGTFSGRSNILGTVAIGSGSGTGAFLAPGVQGPGTLAIHNTLTFKADGTYNCELSTAKAKADQIVVEGITIESGAQFSFIGKGHQALPAGSVFTVINNKSRQPISGAFANLPDNSTFTANGNTFRVSYEGGDGNDLTLIVLP